MKKRVCKYISVQLSNVTLYVDTAVAHLYGLNVVEMPVTSAVTTQAYRNVAHVLDLLNSLQVESYSLVSATKFPKNGLQNMVSFCFTNNDVCDTACFTIILVKKSTIIQENVEFVRFLKYSSFEIILLPDSLSVE
jgi:hypothetical protein